MARRVYFSFHYKGDVWRANQVRNSWVTRGIEAAGFKDQAEFESVERQGPGAIERWIDKNLEGTSVTVILIGEETCYRKYVRYEVEQSKAKHNGIIFVKIHNLKDQNGQTCGEGNLDFGDIDVSDCPVYDYVKDDGYNKMGDWIEASGKASERQELGSPSPRSVRRFTGCGRG